MVTDLDSEVDDLLKKGLVDGCFGYVSTTQKAIDQLRKTGYLPSTLRLRGSLYYFDNTDDTSLDDAVKLADGLAAVELVMQSIGETDHIKLNRIWTILFKEDGKKIVSKNPLLYEFSSRFPGKGMLDSDYENRLLTEALQTSGLVVCVHNISDLVKLRDNLSEELTDNGFPRNAKRFNSGEGLPISFISGIYKL